MDRTACFFKHAAALPWSGIFISAIMVAATGCHGDGLAVRAPVSGTVTFRGKPLPNAEVTFHPASGERVATGRTNAEGRFTLGTFSTNDGAVLGSHVVTIIARGEPRELGPDEIGSGLPGTKASGNPVIPLKYFAPETSGLTYEVKKGPNQFEIALTD